MILTYEKDNIFFNSHNIILVPLLYAIYGVLYSHIRLYGQKFNSILIVGPDDKDSRALRFSRAAILVHNIGANTCRILDVFAQTVLSAIFSALILSIYLRLHNAERNYGEPVGNKIYSDACISQLLQYSARLATVSCKPSFYQLRPLILFPTRLNSVNFLPLCSDFVMREAA